MNRLSALLLYTGVLFLSVQNSEARPYAQSVDPHNTYQFNRKNHLRNNGKVDRSPWFEWWYYKVILPETQKAFYFTYGTVNPWDLQGILKGTRATVEMGDFQTQKMHTLNLSPLDFKAQYDQPKVQVGNNLATDQKFSGELVGIDGLPVRWDIQIQKEWAFNATSWATGKGITQIEWYPAQASAKCTGQVQSGGELYRFSNAPCYQDRNWGREFPKWWAWVVSNHFENSPGTVLAIGGGRPMFNVGIDPVESVAVGIRHQGKEYAWRLNEMDHVRMQIHFGKWEIVAENLKFKAEISAYAPREKFMDLEFMTPEGEIFHDYEALLGTAKVRLYKRTIKGWEMIADLQTKAAGIEYGSHDEYAFSRLFQGSVTLVDR